MDKTRTSFHVKTTKDQLSNFKKVAEFNDMNLSEYVRYLLSIELGKMEAKCAHGRKSKNNSK